MTISSDIGYVLHLRPYRESSQLATLVTLHHGRFNAVSRGLRQKRGGNPLRPFVQLQLSWSGRGELKTLSAVEVAGPALVLQGRTAYVGLYLNELMMRLLHEYEPHTSLVALYWQTLEAVACAQAVEGIEAVLRWFELRLLDELGYGLPLDVDMDTGELVSEEASYHFSPSEGLRANALATAKDVFTGVHLLAIAAGDFSDPQVLKTAKKLTRLALSPYLGPRPLASRELFRGLAGG